MDPSSIFQGETDEVHKKFDDSVKILDLFLNSFEEVRENLSSYFKEDVEPVPWTFHPRNVFQRLMDFTDRLRLVKSMLEAALEFGKLEKVEIGGLKGRILSNKCQEIFEEFNSLYNHLGNIQYDILDPADDNVYADHKIFVDKCNDLDRRLAAIFVQAFDDCNNLESIFKLINIIGILIERPIIAKEVTEKYPLIITLLNEELDTVKVLFDEGLKTGPPIDKCYPPCAGVLFWLFKLRERIKGPIIDFRQLEHEIVVGEDALHVFQKYDEMMDLITSYETRVFNQWAVNVPNQIAKSLSKFHLIREFNTQLISLNFDPELECILREVR